MTDFYSLVLAKKETTYATDAAPVVGTNAVLTRNASRTPIQTETLRRNLDRPARGALPGVPTNEVASISYEMELQGSGAAGTAPPWMTILEGCGMASPVLVASTSATQRFAAINTALSSLTQHGYVGNLLAKMVGSRGDITAIDFTAGAYPFVAVDFLGLVPAATPFSDATPGTPVFTSWKDPLEVNTVNTTFALDGYAAVLRSFQLKANGAPKLRNLVGSRYIQRGNHAMSGNIIVEAPQIATKDYLAKLRSGALIAASVVHGTAAGSIVECKTDFLQIDSIQEQNEDDILMFNIGVTATISAGQDDLVLIAR